MPLDPTVKALMDQMASAGMPPLHTLGPVEARLRANEMLKNMGKPEPVAKTEDRRIAGPAGQIPVRIYWPQGAGASGILIFYHGGGFVICDLDSHDAICRALTNQAGCITVSIDYRLAPEHKFPAAVDDCYAAALWVSENAAALGADTRRLAVGGDSAGGNLSAVVSQLARERGKPAIRHQLLVYPTTDMAADTYSHRTFTDYFLTDKDIKYFHGHYLRSDADKLNPLASPARTRSLRGLPSATVITAEFDPLRDEGEAYAARLREHGVPVALKRYDGMIHGFVSMSDVLPAGKQAIAQAAAALKAALDK